MNVKQIYDADYAKQYDGRFLTSDYAKLASDFELSIIKELVGKDVTWLDVGCGTGYFLRFFPGVNRCGIDLSPDMLDKARVGNEDAHFIEGDFRNVLAEMNQEWKLITCMWTPYNYLGSMAQFDDFISNLIRLTQTGGTLFIPVVDLEDLRPHTVLEYEWYADMFDGTVALTSSTWSWKEHGTGKNHLHLVAPQIGYFIDLLQGYFQSIEVVRYPVYGKDWVSKKAIVAKGKLAQKGTSEVILHKREKVEDTEIPGQNSASSSLKEIGTKTLLKELIARLFS